MRCQFKLGDEYDSLMTSDTGLPFLYDRACPANMKGISVLCTNKIMKNNQLAETTKQQAMIWRKQPG
jgi:hypothetical protein